LDSFSGPEGVVDLVPSLSGCWGGGGLQAHTQACYSSTRELSCYDQYSVICVDGGGFAVGVTWGVHAGAVTVCNQALQRLGGGVITVVVLRIHESKVSKQGQETVKIVSGLGQVRWQGRSRHSCERRAFTRTYTPTLFMSHIYSS
jgi:hypothetical protein